MPSFLLDARSGGVNPFSGSPGFYSGYGPPWPVGGLQYRLSNTASGNAYFVTHPNSFALTSGGVSVGSGLFVGSGFGSGLTDGFLVRPGDTGFIPRTILFPDGSGAPMVYWTCDAAASGQGRLFWYFA